MSRHASSSRWRDRLPGRRSETHFRWRGQEVSRIENLTDAVFGFALTLPTVKLNSLSIAIGLSLIASCPHRSSAAEPLAAAFQSITQQPRYQQAHWGALFVDLASGEVVFEQQADKLFAPASTTKLFSVACALDAFGAGYRFKTSVRQRGEVNQAGELVGDLILVAAGDLSFGGRTTATGEIAFVDSDHTYAN
ncbi:MAG: D-alanyl-D-alanine carboxypeptidase, partial [Phycisphaerales bacterium]|nr:D-alanyl-D-alanine carboxypeptidase [Phycisphaerales bacterium]